MDMQEHIAKEHKISPLSTYLKEIVYGGNDGIVTTFAVVAGFTGAGSDQVAGMSFATVLLFGLANLFADAASMGMGNYLSLRAEKDVYRKEKEKELHEIRHSREFEWDETVQILTHKGYSKKDAEAMAHLYAKNENYWTEFMMHQELEMPNPENVNPYLTGFATFASFTAFGFIPLIPYVFFTASPNIFQMSVAFTAGALILLGFLRANIARRNTMRSILEIVLIGGIAAFVAYFVGTFFRL